MLGCLDGCHSLLLLQCVNEFIMPDLPVQLLTEIKLPEFRIRLSGCALGCRPGTAAARFSRRRA
jgi:hypothetical protein